MYAQKLIESVRAADYAGYDEDKAPPYVVSDEHLRRVMSDKEFVEQLHEKFEITLKLDENQGSCYYPLALLIGWMYNVANSKSGYIARDLSIAPLNTLDEDKIDALLQEVQDLNILHFISNKPGSTSPPGRRRRSTCAGIRETSWPTIRSCPGRTPSGSCRCDGIHEFVTFFGKWLKGWRFGGKINHYRGMGRARPKICRMYYIRSDRKCCVPIVNRSFRRVADSAATAVRPWRRILSRKSRHLPRLRYRWSG